MTHLRIAAAMLGALLVSLLPLRVAAQSSATVELIAARSSVPAGDTLSLAGTVRPSSATPIALQATLSLSPDIASAVLLKSANGECDDAARSCTLTASATAPAQMTIAVVVRSDAPTPGSFTATLAVTGAETGQSEPISVRIDASATPTATTATQPATSTTPIVPTTTPTATEADATPPTATLRPSPSATPDPRTEPDRCESNDTPQRACAIPLDAISGPFTLVPDGDSDYFQLDLGPNSGKPTVVWVRPSDELDLLTTILAGEDRHQVGLIADGVISTTLASDLAGPVLLHVENRAVEPTSGGIYRVEARRSTGLPPPPPPQPRGTVPPPDALENNWSPATAPVIGLDVAYDLNFTCPVPWGCVGGDHDYVKVPVKAGQDYLFATFDLGPGVDTVLDLFWGDETIPIRSNDDAAPGTSALSVLRWRAPSDGTAVVRIAPRAGNLTPVVADEQAGSYRFAVALPRSAFGRELLERIATQTLATPTASRVPTNAPAVAGGSSGNAPAAPAVAPTAITSAIPPGPAQLVAEAPVYLAPDARSERIATLTADTPITLTGQTSNLWVEITSDQLILPGWVAAQAVQRIHTTTVVSPSTAVALPTTSADGTNVGSTPAATPSPAAGAALPLAPLPPLPVPPTPVAPREAFALTVVLQATSGTTSIGPTPTPSRAAGLDGVRVQLVDALGDVLVEGVTRDGGRLVLARDLAPATSVWVRVPAVGITVPIPSPQSPTLTILVPTSQPGGVR